MPATESDLIGSPDLAGFRAVLAEVAPNFGAIPQSVRTLDSAAFYNFYFHEFLFPTETGGYRGYLTNEALATLDQYQTAIGIADSELLLELLSEVEAVVRRFVRRYRRRDWDEQDVARRLLADFHASWNQILPAMVAAFRTERNAGIGRHFLDWLDVDLHLYLLDRVYSWYPHFVGLWSDWASQFATDYAWWHDAIYHDPTEDLPDWAGDRPVSTYETWRKEGFQRGPTERDDLPFEVFDYGSINVGLRLVYRQDWTHLGTQPGEIIKTVPLGPGERVKVAVKVTRRRKESSTLDSSTSTESERESQDSTKDSSEIVREASQTNNWNVSATASAGFMFGSVSVTAGAGGASEEKSRQTGSSLSETMQKTASKTRSETKVQVLRESEDVSELEHVSEISNPNNESAITYEYHKLQHQYEVFSYLAEVQAVVYVAETVPDEIDVAFVRRYDSIIARVLKDESYRQTLNELIQTVDEDGAIDARYGNMFDRAQDRFATFDPKAGAGGVTIPDIYSQSQRTYQDEVRSAAERNRAQRLRDVRRERLFLHIRDNLLHYCQAIWAAEPSDQRLLRYKKEGRGVPVEWRAPLRAQPVGAAPNLGTFTPTGREMPIWELIDPTGPIGYIGNYAVFAIRPQDGLSVTAPEHSSGLRTAINLGDIILGLQDVLAIAMNPYFDPATDALIDPALRASQRRAASVAAVDLRRLTDEQVVDVVSYLPALAEHLLDANGRVARTEANLDYQITAAEWAQYLYRRNNSRRFLLDSNNVYLNIRVSGGAALEPFKRAHRYLDVLKAAEELGALHAKNLRRAALLATEGAFDPDIQKVIVVENGRSASAAAGAEAGAGSGAGASTAADTDGTDITDG